MPLAEVANGIIHYRIDARPGAPVLVFSHSLGTDLSMWDAQVDLLSRDFTILRYDSRGHGRSLVTLGPYTIELLARDVIGLLDQLQIARVHFCGLSLGGMVGIWLAAHEPARLNKLVLANTAAQLGPPENWNSRIQSIREGGMAGVADIVIARWFTPVFRQRCPAKIEAARMTLLATSPDGYTACCAAIRDMDQRAELEAIGTPTLVISGRDDPATPPATCQLVADGIRGARITELQASHLSNIEAADSFNLSVLDFLRT